MKYSIFSLATAGAALAAIGHASPTDTQGRGCEATCRNLQRRYPGQVLHPNTPAYDNFTQGYWAKQQRETSPRCIFSPQNAEEVSSVVKDVAKYQCPFAARSGGHGQFAGVSSTDGGIVISMKSFDQVTVSEDTSTVTLGTGNTWLSVYKTLGPQHITVPGGRYPTVGTGGLPLGGGISFFSNTYGWMCDSIVKYEVVLANGTIVEASNTSHPDLHWALRGGGNNFGIVTKIGVEAISLPEGKIWGGRRIMYQTELPRLIQAAYNLGTKGVEENPGVGQTINVGKAQGYDIATATLFFVEPIEDPPIMKEFLDIPYEMDTTAVRTLSNMSADMGMVGDLSETSKERRRARGAVTFRLDVDMMLQAKDICMEEFDGIQDIEHVDTICVFQVITKTQLEASERKGGNVMGLSAEDGPFFLLSINVAWDHEADDARVKQIPKDIIRRAEEYAAPNGLELDFKYMNYAGEFQDVIAGYGEKNKARLIDVAARYDLEGVFQKLSPGWFKLDGAPERS